MVSLFEEYKYHDGEVKMFEPCPLIDNKKCPFASLSNYKPKDKKLRGGKELFCGIAKGMDNRIKHMYKCWKFMNQGERKKHNEKSNWLAFK